MKKITRESREKQENVIFWRDGVWDFEESIGLLESKQPYGKGEMKYMLTFPTKVRSSVKFPS